MKLVLEINLGNDAMQTPQDVHEAISRCAWPRLDDNGLVIDSGVITDRNGNTVGHFKVTEE